MSELGDHLLLAAGRDCLGTVTVEITKKYAEISYFAPLREIWKSVALSVALVCKLGQSNGSGRHPAG